MRKLRLIFIWTVTFGFLFAGESGLPDDACVSCHLAVDEDRDADTKIMTNIRNDIHIQKDLSCADCHGGDPQAFNDEDEAMWDNSSFIGTIDKKDQPEVCGKCHSDPAFMRQYSVTIKTDQVAQYRASKHGIVLKEGNSKVAVCTDCHGVHGIFPVDDPRSPVYALNVPSTCAKCHSNRSYMSEFGIPTDQFANYKSSVHGEALLKNKDVGAPACNDCHGNHGAFPPSVVHVKDICGSCHVNNATLFQNSHLKDAFLKNGLGQCEGCHSNHGIQKPTDNFLNWDHGAVCQKCHTADHVSRELAGKFYKIIDGLKGKIETAKQLVNSAEQKGMEVSDMLFPLEDAHQALIQTRTSIHSFNEEHVKKTAEAGFKGVNDAIEGANASLKEYDFRRKGLLVSFLIITFLVITMYLKVKDMERRDK